MEIHFFGAARTTTEDVRSRVEHIDLGVELRSVAAGYFIWNRNADAQIAVTGEDATVRILQRGALNTRPFTDGELAERARARQRPQRQGSELLAVPAWQPYAPPSWTTARRFVGNAAGARSGAVMARDARLARPDCPVPRR